MALCINRDIPEPFVPPGPVPGVTYTDRELAHAGQSPVELHAAGTAFRTISQSFADVPRGVTTGQTTGQLKIYDDDGRILGVPFWSAKRGNCWG